MAKKNNAETKHKKIKVFKIVSIIAIIILVLIIMLPTILSSKVATRIIVNKVSAAADADIELNNLTISWQNGITLEGVSYADSSGIIVDAQRIYAKPSYISLMGGIIEISQAVIQNASITVVVDENNPTDFSDEALATVAAFIPPKTISAATTPTKFQWGKFNYIKAVALDLSNTSVILELIGIDGERSNFALSGIEGKIRINPPGHTCGIDVKAFAGSENAPMNLYLLASRPQRLFIKEEFSAAVKTNIDNLDLASIKPLLSIAGVENEIGGIVDFQVNAEIKEGLVDRSRADINSKEISYILNGTQNKVVIKDFTSTASISVDENFIKVNEIKADSDWFKLDAGGQFPLSTTAIDDFFNPTSEYSFDIKLTASLSKALAQFPEIMGKSDMEVRTGDIIGNFSTSNLTADSKVFYGNISLSNFSAISDGKVIKLNAPVMLRTEIASRDNGLLIDPLELSTEFLNLSCSGHFDDLKIHGILSLPAAQNELKDFVDFGNYRYGGELVINADLVPSLKVLNGTAILDNFRVTNSRGNVVSDPYSDMSFGLKYDKVEKRLWLTSFFLKSTMLGELELLQGFFNFREEDNDKFVSMFKYNSELANIFKVLDVYGKKPENFDASGLFSTTTRFIMRDDGLRAVSEDTGATNLVITSAENHYNTAGVNATFDVDVKPKTGEYYARNLGIRNEWLDIDFSKFSYKTNDKKSELEADYALAYNLQRLMEIEKFIPESMLLKGERRQTGSIKTTIYPDEDSSAIKNLEASLGLGFDSINYVGLGFGKCDFTVSVKDGLATVPIFAVPLNGGALNLGLSADITSENILLKVDENLQLLDSVNINDELSNELLKFVNPIFAGSVSSSGQFNLLCRKLEIPLKENILDNMIADAQIEIKDLRIQPAGMLSQILELTKLKSGQIVALGTSPTNINIADGRLSYDEMLIYLAGKPVSFGGSIAFAGDIDMNTKVPYTYSIGSRREMLLTLPIDGDVSNPRIDTRKLLEQNTEAVGQVVEDLIGENVDESTAEIIKESVRGLQELFRNR